MQNKKFEQQMRTYEFFKWINVPEKLFIVVQLRLKNFSNVVETFKSPFNANYRSLMITTAQSLMSEFRGIYAETHKDEISVLLPREYTQYDRNAQRLLTLFASVAASTFSLQYGDSVQFEGSLFTLPNEDAVYDYFRWRQADASRYAAFTHAVTQHKRAKKISSNKAEEHLRHMGYDKLTSLMKSYSFNFNDQTPAWHRRGVAIYWRTYFKTNKNPEDGVTHTVPRRQLYADLNLPTRDAYAAYVYRKGLFGYVDKAVPPAQLS